MYIIYVLLICLINLTHPTHPTHPVSICVSVFVSSLLCLCASGSACIPCCVIDKVALSCSFQVLLEWRCSCSRDGTCLDVIS